MSAQLLVTVDAADLLLPWVCPVCGARQETDFVDVLVALCFGFTCGACRRLLDPNPRSFGKLHFVRRNEWPGWEGREQASPTGYHVSLVTATGVGLRPCA